MSKLPMPQPVPIVRENRDVVVELQQEGQCVGEINFTAIFEGWFRKLGWGTSDPSLKLVR